MQKSVLYFVTVVLATMALAQDYRPQSAYRFLAVTRSNTQLVLTTTTLTKTVPSFCYSPGAGLSQCRLARGLKEVPKILLGEGEVAALASDIEPSKPETVLATIAAVLEPTANEIQRLNNVEIQSSSSEVERTGLNQVGRSYFGFTIHYTTTSTLILTSFSTAFSGLSTFTVLGCTPAGWTYTTCVPEPCKVNVLGICLPL